MRICLSMIVKNEAAVIERCLTSVKPFIQAWAISDTGSTDGTQDIIRRILGGLPGELIERPWVDFSTNRNQALDLAKKYGDYALLIDADDSIVADRYPEPAADCYYAINRMEGLVYRMPHLIRLDKGFFYRGVTHESLECAQPYSRANADGILYVRGQDSSRRINGNKFLDDANLLIKGLHDEPGNARYQFYLAQSWRDAGRLPDAIAAYEKRAAMGGWAEEVYFSRLQIAVLKERSGATYAQVVAAYLDACDCRPSRAEAPCELARYLRLHERWNLAYRFAQIAADLPPSDDLLFIDSAVHDWRARDELSIAAYWCGDYAQSAALCRELLADARLPAGEHERVRKNLEFALPHLATSA
ncbi:MAG: glycosyltransferase [Proteobacteria bacterium]|nr:glycosyltransferase [Pseudomonadota bacterium]